MSKPLKCPVCGDLFEPNSRQQGQKRRGRSLYCSPECCAEAHRRRMRAWRSTDEGKAYYRNRYLDSIRTSQEDPVETDHEGEHHAEQAGGDRNGED